MRPLQLETFDRPPPPPPPPEVDTRQLHLSAYEQGYAAGWEDCAAAQDGEVAQIRGDLGRNLQALSFSYHEARQHVLKVLEPLLLAMVGKVLPTIARESLGAMVMEQIRPLAEEQAQQPIEILANPSNVPLIERLLADSPAPPFRIIGEASLGPGQVHLRLGSSERLIDLDGVLAAIAGALAAFFTPDSAGDAQ